VQRKVNRLIRQDYNTPLSTVSLQSIANIEKVITLEATRAANSFSLNDGSSYKTSLSNELVSLQVHSLQRVAFTFFYIFAIESEISAQNSSTRMFNC
jgi:hypothetical protein